MPKSVFPKNFLWGASTAGHQVEGGNHNDWTVWELGHAKELAKNAVKKYGGLPNWRDIRDQAEDPNNYVSGRGVDHYTMYKYDFKIMRALNLNAFRFGIEWSRLEPEEGQWDEEAVEHYREYIKQMHAHHLEPLLNIWHWTVPVWFAEKGGFQKRHNLKYFDRFVQKISTEFGTNLSHIITINEPNVYTSLGYLIGSRPPQQRNPLHASVVIWNLHKAHKRAYKILKNDHPHLQVGVASQLGNIQAKRPHSVTDELSTKVMRYLWNWWFLRRIRRQQDFIGINYYFTDYYKNFSIKDPKIPINDLGWYMEPEGVYPLILRAWTRYKKPIIITENGVADAHDQYRRWWLEETIVAMERALSEGVDLRGYYHWSLLDNFEWESGYFPKFGLVEVDREHGMKRKVRPSAKWLAKFLAEIRS